MQASCFGCIQSLLLLIKFLSLILKKEEEKKRKECHVVAMEETLANRPGFGGDRVREGERGDLSVFFLL